LKVLILGLRAGGGHLAVAQNIKKALTEKGIKDILIIDTLRYVKPLYGWIVNDFYLFICKRAPSIYKYLYSSSEQHRGKRYRIRRLLIRKTETKILSLIENFKPSAIICTHSYGAIIASYLKLRYQLSYTLIGVITDYYTHPLWLNSGIDFYVVATQRMKERLVLHGIEESKILVLGIPISPSFNTAGDGQEIINHLGLEKGKFTLLVMAGATGMDLEKYRVEYLLSAGLPIQVIIVSGTNQKFKQRLLLLKRKGYFNTPTSIIGFSDQIPQLMKISDVLLTKPGGVTIAEAFASSLPLILTKALVGVEERNAREVLQLQAGIQVGNPFQLPSLLNKLQRSREKLIQLSENAKRAGVPDSALKLAEIIISHRG
jgi:processive 1,2-diacylglycerol beta-glucosyltransferase